MMLNTSIKFFKLIHLIPCFSTFWRLNKYPKCGRLELIHCFVDHFKCTKWCCLDINVNDNISLIMIWLKALLFKRNLLILDTYFIKNSVELVYLTSSDEPSCSESTLLYSPIEIHGHNLNGYYHYKVSEENST